MKKTLLLSSILCVSAAANAQITLTQADFVTVGKTVIQGTDTSVTAVAGTAGANRTWNFTSLTADQKDTIDVVAPSATPYASSFPGSNLAGYSHGTNGDFYYYLNSSASSFQIDGAAGQGVLVDYTPNEVLTPLSATYGTTFNNTFSYKTDIPYAAFPGYDSIRIKSTTIKSGNYDAYGTVTISMGMYNTIRLAETKYTVDSVFLHSTGPFPPAGWSFAQETKDTTFSYSWYANNVGYTLVKIDSNRVDGKSATFLLAEPLSVSSVQLKEAGFYPNPATGFIQVNYSGASNDLLTVYDVAGNLVKSEVLSNGMNRVDIQALSAGMYIYTISGKEGTMINTGKFSVIK